MQIYVQYKIYIFTYRNSVGNLESNCSEASDAIEGGQPVSGQGDALQKDIEDANEHNGSDGRHKSRVNLTDDSNK